MKHVPAVAHGPTREALSPGPVALVGAEDAGLFQRAQSLAVEHVIWAAAAGLHPNDVLQAIRSQHQTGDWERVRVEVARAAVELLREREGRSDG